MIVTLELWMLTPTLLVLSGLTLVWVVRSTWHDDGPVPWKILLGLFAVMVIPGTGAQYAIRKTVEAADREKAFREAHIAQESPTYEERGHRDFRKGFLFNETELRDWQLLAWQRGWIEEKRK